MSDRPAVNIVHRHGTGLFAPHFDRDRDGFDVYENGDPAREWDLLIVFEALGYGATYRVRTGGTVFISGEPPEISRHAARFLAQFDAVFCAQAPDRVAPRVSREQHFNNWHFGYHRESAQYRLDHRTIADFAPPAKTRDLSTITSNLNYLPMHIRRKALVGRLSQEFAGQIDVFGRPHRFVEYKEDAILPYRFHLCVENCSIPGLWTEKIADALLGYAVPIYAGCPNIEEYFPGAVISIDVDDHAAARRTVEAILTDGEATYARYFEALVRARRRLIEDFDISTLIGMELRHVASAPFRSCRLRPEADLPMARMRDLVARIRRKAVAAAWRAKVNRRG